MWEWQLIIADFLVFVCIYDVLFYSGYLSNNMTKSQKTNIRKSTMQRWQLKSYQNLKKRIKRNWKKLYELDNTKSKRNCFVWAMNCQLCDKGLPIKQSVEWCLAEKRLVHGHLVDRNLAEHTFDGHLADGRFTDSFEDVDQTSVGKMSIRPKSNSVKCLSSVCSAKCLSAKNPRTK